MRIAFDLDGVLADLHEPFVQTALRLFPELDLRAISSADVGASPPDDSNDNSPPADGTAPPPNLSLTRHQNDAVWRAIGQTPDFWEQLKEIEQGAIAKLAKIADERGWEILFITSRPKSGGRTVQRQSQRWLERQGFPLPSCYVVHGSRGRIAAALAIDVVIDDRPDNCLDIVLESRAGAILVWRGPTASVPGSAKRLGIAVVSTVAEALDALIVAEGGDAAVGLLDRLRKVFGLRTKSKSPLIR